jgi:hypothetical protein
MLLDSRKYLTDHDLVMRTIEGRIRRRVLVNLRVDPAAARRLVPRAFELDLVGGMAMAGICLIELDRIRPTGVPSHLGVASGNVAYRWAVRTQLGTDEHGVFISRRDTTSNLQARLAGHVFPGRYGRVDMRTLHEDGRIGFDVRSTDGSADVRLDAIEADGLPAGSVFDSLAEASAFFERASLGFSPSAAPGRLDAIRLLARTWTVAPLRVLGLASSFFGAPDLLAPGSWEVDDALLMQNVDHRWQAVDTAIRDDREAA